MYGKEHKSSAVNLPRIWLNSHKKSLYMNLCYIHCQMFDTVDIFLSFSPSRKFVKSVSLSKPVRLPRRNSCWLCKDVPPEIWGFRKEDRKRNRLSITIRSLENLTTIHQFNLVYLWYFQQFHELNFFREIDGRRIFQEFRSEQKQPASLNDVMRN